MFDYNIEFRHIVPKRTPGTASQFEKDENANVSFCHERFNCGGRGAFRNVNYRFAWARFDMHQFELMCAFY